MPRNFDWLPSARNGLHRGPRLWLEIVGGTLALLNAIALFLYLAPPGGTRKELEQERLGVRNQIAALRAQTLRVKTAAAKVEIGNAQSADFELNYFLPKRMAYEAVIAELQRMAAASNLQERDAAFTEEAIEGTSDLAVLNIAAHYDGPYENLMRFLYEVDQSPMLLMLEQLQASPQQQTGRINAAIRFQAIIQDDTGGAIGGQP